MSSPWFTFLPLALFFAWCIFQVSRLGPACPACGSPLPVFQSPITKTGRQWAEGGYVCPNCDCETDAAGARVPKGTSPRWHRVALTFGLPALTLVAIIVLVATLSQR